MTVAIEHAEAKNLERAIRRVVFPVCHLINIKAPSVKSEAVPYPNQSLLEDTIGVLERFRGQVLFVNSLTTEFPDIKKSCKYQRREQSHIMHSIGRERRMPTGYWQHVSELSELAWLLTINQCCHIASVFEGVIADLKQRV